MALNEVYRSQVDLLLRSVPAIAKEKCFALKGGTAINLFVRDLPRLSVDIDLTYVPVSIRTKSLAAIDKAMTRIAGRLRNDIRSSHVYESKYDGSVTKLIVRERGIQIKIEVTPVLRGSVYEPEVRSVSPAVEEMFGFAEMKVVSFADLYAGKIVAAIDRQHPRDLFDVRDLLANEGITDEIRAAFIVYLISHSRPMSEVLGSRQKDIAHEYANNFRGMTLNDVALDELLAARASLIDAILRNMPDDHRTFLVSFEKGEPDWSLLGLKKINKLPAVNWRMQNLGKISKNKRAELAANLEHVLGLEITPAQLTLLPEPSGPRKAKRKKPSLTR
jgi:predicted nucleotidyltransferase component of viral defense system